jgi:hypothetical protein
LDRFSIATLYHLIYRDWNAVIAQQASALDAIIRRRPENETTT